MTKWDRARVGLEVGCHGRTRGLLFEKVLDLRLIGRRASQSKVTVVRESSRLVLLRGKQKCFPLLLDLLVELIELSLAGTGMTIHKFKKFK